MCPCATQGLFSFIMEILKMAKKANNTNFIAIITSFFIVLLSIGGWISNIVKLFEMNWDVGVTIEAMIRIVGIIVFPLGVIMGFL